MDRGETGARVLELVERKKAKGHVIGCATIQNHRMAAGTVLDLERTVKLKVADLQKRNAQVSILCYFPAGRSMYRKK